MEDSNSIKNEVRTKRNTWVACPKCGHKVAKVRTCDMELKCKHCGCEFEVVIGTFNEKQECVKRK